MFTLVYEMFWLLFFEWFLGIFIIVVGGVFFFGGGRVSQFFIVIIVVFLREIGF